GFQKRSRNIIRVDFKGKFLQIQRECLADSFQDALDLFGLQQGRRATAKIDGLDPFSCVGSLTVALDFFNQAVNEVAFPGGLGYEVKITVRASLLTKRYVDVNAGHQEC